MVDHGLAFINSFVVKNRRSRMAFDYQKGCLAGRFCHDAESLLDPRFYSRIEGPIIGYKAVLKLLISLGAGKTCHAISHCEAIDGRDLLLEEALSNAVGFGLPSIVSCLPGELVYLETEQSAGPPDRYILARK